MIGAIDKEILDKVIGKTIASWKETEASNGIIFQFSDGSFLRLEVDQETSLDGEEIYEPYITVF